MKYLIGFLGLGWSLAISAADHPVGSIAFGSCNLQLRPQNFWTNIAREKADLWIWMGDIVYTDFLSPPQREREYNRVKNSAGYQELRKLTKVLGTWDDHDYGKDNAGVEFADKANSQKLVLDFLDEPLTSPRRQQAGIYDSYVAGPIGQQVKVILMDQRYFREPPGPKAQMLGEVQWRWLESQLLAGDEALTLLVSSSQVLPTDSANDKWADYPAEKKRLLDLMERSHRNLLILSGDVHFAELSRGGSGGQEWLEATSSGLTHVTPKAVEKNGLRVGPFLPKLNFGLLTLHWAERSVDVTIQLKSVSGSTLYQYPVTYRW